LQAKQYIGLTDEELYKLYYSCKQPDLLGILLQRYTLLLLGVAMKYLKDRTAAQDAVQQVFLKTITHLPTEPVQNFKGWLYILMRNHCLQILRDKQYLTEDSILELTPLVEDDRDERIWKEATLEKIEPAIAMLDEQQRACITLFYLQKKSYKQITDETGFSFEQVKSYIQNGKRNLKILLTKKG
jgi:RNA polymerase sigma factor (sigma-70 family)